MPKDSRHMARCFRCLSAFVATPIVLFLVASALLCLPPVQKWAIDKACAYAERQTGYRIHMDAIRLAFPIDVVMEGFSAQDSTGDTLLYCRAFKAKIPLRPLLDKRVDVDGASFCKVKVNTKSLISDTHVDGTLEYADVNMHGYSWTNNVIDNLKANVKGADLNVVLTDTAAEDTTPTSPWTINLSHAHLQNSRVRLTLPADSSAVVTMDVALKEATAHNGHFDTGKSIYTLHHATLHTRPLTYESYVIPAFDAVLDSVLYTPKRIGAIATICLNDTIYTHDKLSVSAKLEGSLNDVNIRRLTLEAPQYGTLSIAGHCAQLLEEAPHGTFHVNASTKERLNALARPYTGTSFHIPANTQLSGQIGLNGWNKFSANLHIASAGGKAHLIGRYNTQSETYKVQASLRDMPLKAFMPELPIKPITARLEADGSGVNSIPEYGISQIRVKIFSGGYADYPLDNTRIKAHLHNGDVQVAFVMANRMLDGEGTIGARIHGGYNVDVNACVSEFRPYEVGLMTDTLCIGSNFTANLSATKTLREITSQGLLGDICLVTNDTIVNAHNLSYNLMMSPDTTQVNLISGDLDLGLGISGSVDTLVTRSQNFVQEFIKQLERRDLQQSYLASLLPRARLSLKAGHTNPLSNILKLNGYRLSNINLLLDASPTHGLSGWAHMGSLGIGALQLDTMYADIFQDETGLKLIGQITNDKKDNPNHFNATIDAYALSSGAGADLVFKDGKGHVGIDMGMQATFEDNGINIHLSPRTPIVAYRQFTLNDDNYIKLNKDSTIHANIDLIADDGTGLKIYGAPTDEGDNDITLSINRLNIGELSSVLLWLPPMKGYLSGDLHVTNANDVLSAMASLETTQFAYNGVELGQIGMEATYLPKSSGEHYAMAYLSYQGEEVAEATGSYFTAGEGRFEGNVQLSALPMSLVDAFLVGTGLNMEGYAQGTMHAEGTLNAPTLNGAVTFVDTHIYSKAYGFNFTMDKQPVEIKNNKIVFDHYTLHSTGKSPFEINGCVDASDLSHITVAMDMNTHNFELINTPRTKDSELYGKLYTDFTGTVRGTLPSLAVRGNLGILDRTNMTYVMRDTPISVNDEFAGLVTFTNFADTLSTNTAQNEETTSIDLSMVVDINEGAHLQCLLAEDGHSYVDVIGGGVLNFRYTPHGDINLTGRYTINSGKMKYELPVIPLKTFKLEQGSYVEFTGDILNPTLNITATERMKASVSDNEQQRTLPFDVGVSITQSLNNMGLEFIIDSPDDATIQNDLAAMTPIQRNKTAVAMMATGLYVTDDFSSMTNGFNASNALNMFLQKSIQGIAGTALSTVDFNFDIDSSTSSSGNTTTDYNFAFAKRFWGDHINVIIGGKVSTGAESSNSAASIIDNVSVEYRLDKGATRYIRLFYDRSANDMLEGRQMETGAGLILRRKTNKLGELFLFRKPRQ